MKGANERFVEVRLKRIYLERAGRPVLREVDWTVRPGERWVLAGGNGAGKTQLLKLISGAVWPTPTGHESRRYVWGGEVFKTPADVKEEIAYVGPERQDRYERYGWNHSVFAVVGTGLYRTDIPLNVLTAADGKRIGALLERLGISHLAERTFLSLSYGERRLTLLARALASRPGLLLLDELLNGLDVTNQQRAMHWLESTGRSPLPWVLATHRAADVPSCATHALLLDEGRVVYRGVIGKAPLERWLNQNHEAAGLGSVGRRRVAQKARGAGARLKEGQLSTQPLLQLHNARVWLDEKEILRGVSLDIRPGDCWVIHGANGSGKTTLLRTLFGDFGVADNGSIKREGIEPGVPLEIFKKRTGFVAAHLQADHGHHLKVDEIVQSGRHASIGLNDAPTAKDREAARKALAFFDLEGFGGRTREELSYGQMRRVLFARAWVTRPKLLLLDEPLAGVDAPTRRVLLDRIGKLVADGTAVVMTTHHRDEWPPYATHELELAKGKPKYVGPMRSVADSRSSAATAPTRHAVSAASRALSSTKGSRSAMSRRRKRASAA